MKIFIVEDEWANVALMRHFLSESPYPVEVVGDAPSVQQAVSGIEQTSPDLVFLDIRLQDGLGFQVLELLPQRNFAVVFTTAYENYAIRAFECAALHYLLKPLSPEAVYEALARAIALQQKPPIDIITEQIPIATQSIATNAPTKIALSLQEGLRFVVIADIVYLEADSNYTRFYLKNKESILISKSLRHYEEILPTEIFFRIHDKHIINVHQVVQYFRGRGGQVEMQGGAVLDVAARRKDLFLEKLRVKS